MHKAVSDPSSIFYAEIFALWSAVSYIKQYCSPGNFMIVTDSLSALKALEAQKMDTGSLDILIKIKLFLDSMFSDGFNFSSSGFQHTVILRATNELTL